MVSQRAFGTVGALGTPARPLCRAAAALRGAAALQARSGQWRRGWGVLISATPERALAGAKGIDLRRLKRAFWGPGEEAVPHQRRRRGKAPGLPGGAAPGVGHRQRRPLHARHHRAGGPCHGPRALFSVPIPRCFQCPFRASFSAHSAPLWVPIPRAFFGAHTAPYSVPFRAFSSSIVVCVWFVWGPLARLGVPCPT